MRLSCLLVVFWFSNFLLLLELVLSCRMLLVMLQLFPMSSCYPPSKVLVFCIVVLFVFVF